MKYKVAGTVALLSALAVGNVDAQQRAPRPVRPNAGAPDSMRNRMQDRRPENMGHPASALLRMRQQLGLTDAQVQRLEGLRQSPIPEVSESARLRAQADLVDAMRGDGNPEAARAALERIHKLQIDRQVAHIRARKEAREVLTAQQKTQLDQLERRLVDNRKTSDGPNGRVQPRGARRDGQGLGPDGIRRGPAGPGQIPPRRPIPPARGGQ